MKFMISIVCIQCCSGCGESGWVWSVEDENMKTVAVIPPGSTLLQSPAEALATAMVAAAALGYKEAKEDLEKVETRVNALREKYRRQQ